MTAAPSSAVYEKLGAFYLGREYDLGKGEMLPPPVLYDSKDLTTHAVCVGMTGSGKTGLCIGLLEEAALDGVPAIVIDPKGDIANLLLTFPDLKPKDFEPWVDPGAAQRKGMDAKEFAAAQAKLWKKGLKSWGQTGERIKTLRESVDMTVYTPGSSAGVGLTPLKSFDAPGAAVINDSEALRDRVSSSVSGLLSLLGVKNIDPVQSPEHILLSTILERAWKSGRGVDLASLIPLVQNPPFDRIGVLDVDSFMPAKDRMKLALKLNNLLASPEFASWLDGEPLDIHKLLYTQEGKPRISILSIAHLSESERMFFVTLVLSEMVAWMRTQSGTSSLRAMMYMDEVFGYFPPTKNPPSKKPLLTMMKQARAYGVGVVLATQNPVDLDYKGLSNAGTWFLGRLQTERDKKRVLEGLEGAAASNSANFDKGKMDKILAGLGKRVFLMHNVHEDGPVVFHTRWVMSYLRGPLTRTQIRTLMKDRKTIAVPRSTVKAPPTVPQPVAPAPEPIRSAPIPAAGVPVGYLAMVGQPAANEQICYAPALCVDASMHYVRASAKVDEWRDVRMMAMLDEGVGADPWGEAFETPVDADLFDEPDLDGAYDALPGRASRKTAYKSWSTRAKAHLYREQALSVHKCKLLKVYSELGEEEGAFRVRLRDTLREHRDEKLDALRRKYGTKVDSLKKKIVKAEQKIDVETSQYKTSRLSTAASFGATILGALLGRKAVSATNVRSAGTAASRASRTAKERGDIGRAKDNLAGLNEQLAALETEFESELGEVRDGTTVEGLEIEKIVLGPRKTEMGALDIWLVWVPVAQDPKGRRRMMIEL